MGSYAYDYLNDSLLLDSTLVTRRYSGVSDAVLELELIKYREYCLKVLPEIRDVVKSKGVLVAWQLIPCLMLLI